MLPWSETMKVRIITGKEVARAVSMAEAIEAVREAFIQLSEGKARVPLRTHIPVDKKGTALFMSAFLRERESLGVKIVSVFPLNAEKSLPTIHAVVVVLDAETGQPVALVESSYLTALRTGAASGLATDLLARKEARVAALFGAGVQSRTQLEGICSVRFLEKIWVYDTDHEKTLTFIEEMKQHGRPFPVRIIAAISPSQAVGEADIICTATTSQRPVFEDADLKEGVHINGIGSFTPEMQEIPTATVKRAKVVVDSMEAVLEEAGDLIIPLRNGVFPRDHIHGEIGDVASGKIPARESEQELTFFKSVGVAVQDVAVASLVLQKCVDLGLGCEVEI
ncbi:MAG: ornithine cyclodeaminase family protein [Candidatus Aminicenantales bacterium]